MSEPNKNQQISYKRATESPTFPRPAPLGPWARERRKKRPVCCFQHPVHSLPGARQKNHNLVILLFFQGQFASLFKHVSNVSHQLLGFPASLPVNQCGDLTKQILWKLDKKKSHDVPSQMCWIPRKDLMTYHPRCVEFQEKISWHNIPDVFKSKERYYTPPHPPHPPPPQPTPRQKKQHKNTKKKVSLRRNTVKKENIGLAVAPVQWTSKNTVSWCGLLRAPRLVVSS